jgi:hypothetical protein
MIECYEEDGFGLRCDHCEDECDEIFGTFHDAIEYKKDKDNGWRSIKDQYDDWYDLCPSCNNEAVSAEIRGEKQQRKPPGPEDMVGF